MKGDRNFKGLQKASDKDEVNQPKLSMSQLLSLFPH